MFQFGGLESPLTGLYDEFKGVMRMKYFREILTLVIVGSAFLCSLPCLTEVSFSELGLFLFLSQR